MILTFARCAIMIHTKSRLQNEVKQKETFNSKVAISTVISYRQEFGKLVSTHLELKFVLNV